MTGTPSQLRVEINEHSVSLTTVADKHTHAMTYSGAITFARALLDDVEAAAGSGRTDVVMKLTDRTITISTRGAITLAEMILAETGPNA